VTDRHMPKKWARQLQGDQTSSRKNCPKCWPSHFFAKI
jgi:ribosomal protein S27AE